MTNVTSLPRNYWLGRSIWTRKNRTGKGETWSPEFLLHRCFSLLHPRFTPDEHVISTSFLNSTNSVRMDTELQREIERLHEKCRRLDFENRRLRRTLRCVDCNSRIASAAAREQSAATKKPGRLGITASTSPLRVEPWAATAQPTTWDENFGPQKEGDELRFTEYLSPLETTLASPTTTWNEGNAIFDAVLWSNADSSYTTGLLDLESEAT
ncbi:hypothetical protein BDV12DRAFT_205141 [Aspergillus spectabilis]